MSDQKQRVVVPTRVGGDAFTLLRQMTAELDRAIERWPSFRWAPFEPVADSAVAWSPRIDVFEKDNRLVTRVDLPGTKKEDVSVEVAEGHLVLFGERHRESDPKKDNVYRTEREYGSFYRAVPLPDGVKPEDVKASFSDGVLEVTVPLGERPEARVRKVQIEEGKPVTATA
jgi:HSP20 family protein